MDRACDREAVLGLRVVDRVTADDRDAGRPRDILAPAQNFCERTGPQLLDGPCDHIQRRQRPRAHRATVRQRIGGGDATEVVGVVDHRREEVDTLHERKVFAQAVDARVILGRDPDQQVGVIRLL